MSSRKIAVRVVPNASRSEVLGWEPAPDGLAGHSRVLRVRLAAPPVDGKANDELIKVLSKASGVSKSAIHIKHGASGRLKTVEVPENWHIQGDASPP